MPACCRLAASAIARLFLPAALRRDLFCGFVGLLRPACARPSRAASALRAALRRFLRSFGVRLAVQPADAAAGRLDLRSRGLREARPPRPSARRTARRRRGSSPACSSGRAAPTRSVSAFTSVPAGKRAEARRRSLPRSRRGTGCGSRACTPCGGRTATGRPRSPGGRRRRSAPSGPSGPCVEYVPWPLALPRPTRLRLCVAPFGWRSSCCCIYASSCTTHQVAHLRDHAADRAVVVVLDGLAELAQAERADRALLVFLLVDAAALPGDLDLRHRDASARCLRDRRARRARDLALRVAELRQPVRSSPSRR